MKYLSSLTISLFFSLTSSVQCETPDEELSVFPELSITSPITESGVAPLTDPFELGTIPVVSSFTDPLAPPSTLNNTRSTMTESVVTIDESRRSSRTQEAPDESCCNCPITEIWLGRAFRVFGKPLIAMGTALTFESITAGDTASSMAIGGTIAAAAGGFMNTIGKKIEDRGMRQAAEREAARKHVASPQTPAEVQEGADSFLSKNKNFRACDTISAKVYNAVGTACTILGQPLAIIGGIIYMYGHNTENDLTNIGIALGTAGVTLDTFGSELENLAREREEELDRFKARDEARKALRGARRSV